MNNAIILYNFTSSKRFKGLNCDCLGCCNNCPIFQFIGKVTSLNIFEKFFGKEADSRMARALLANISPDDINEYTHMAIAAIDKFSEMNNMPKWIGLNQIYFNLIRWIGLTDHCDWTTDKPKYGISQRSQKYCQTRSVLYECYLCECDMIEWMLIWNLWVSNAKHISWGK